LTDGVPNEAGYSWADRRGLIDAAKCPIFDMDFREGCESYAQEQRKR
jgi:hypothetical protein